MKQDTAKRSSLKDVSLDRSTRFKSLLVPIDLTPSSDRILGRVALLPLADGAVVTLLHVVPGGLPPGAQRDAERDASKALASEARHLRKSLPKGTSIAPIIEHGAAADVIGSCAKETQAELIVMGRGGGSALRDAFLGATAERVVRQARLPVLVVRLPPRAVYSRPALALDLDQTADEIVRVMLRVLPPPRPTVSVIHAYDMPYAGLIYPSLPTDEYEQRQQQLQLRATRELTKRLSAALTTANVAQESAPCWKTHVLHGSPRSVIERAMKKTDSDLLVLGTRAYSGAAYVFLGSVAGDLLREAKRDVLVVPPPPPPPPPA